MAVPVYASTQELVVLFFRRQVVLFRILDPLFLLLVPVRIADFTKFLEAYIPEIGCGDEGYVLE